MVEIGRELIARIKGYAPGILCDAGVDKGTSSVHIINSQGGDTGYNKSFFGVGLTGILIHDTDMLFVGDSENSCRFFARIDDLASRVIGQLELAKGKAAVAGKVLPVIFTPRGVASALLGPLELAFNGKTVLEGASRLKGRLREQVFDKRFSLWDDATLAYGIGSRPYDDEGVPSRRVPLVTHGVISNFLYDLQTAALAGTQSTGSGQRVGGGQIRTAISSLIIGGGD